jgi:hypothetical protein
MPTSREIAYRQSEFGVITTLPKFILRTCYVRQHPLNILSTGTLREIRRVIRSRPNPFDECLTAVQEGFPQVVCTALKSTQTATHAAFPTSPFTTNTLAYEGRCSVRPPQVPVSSHPGASPHTGARTSLVNKTLQKRSPVLDKQAIR